MSVTYITLRFLSLGSTDEDFKVVFIENRVINAGSVRNLFCEEDSLLKKLSAWFLGTFAQFPKSSLRKISVPGPAAP